MKFKFKKFDIKRVISILGAIAILLASMPLNTFFVGATTAEGSTIDFENADAEAIVDGNDAFSLLGQDIEDKCYFYAKNNTIDTLSITFDNIQLEADKQYTVDFDVYTLRMSEDEDNILLGVKVYGDSDTALEDFIANDEICEENWANYHTTFTASDNIDKLDFSIFTIGKVFIDNFAIIDEDGNETPVDCAAACEATELTDHFSMATLYEIAYEDPDIINGYLRAAVPENSTISYNAGVDIPFNLNEALPAGKYKLSLDVKFTAVGSCRTSFCASIAGMNVDIKQHWIDAVDIELNKYNTYTFDFDLTDGYGWFRFNVYQGCTAYIDNLILTDAAGGEVININFDEPVSFNGSAYEQKGIAKTQAASYAMLMASVGESDNYVVEIDNSQGTGFGQLYLHDVGMPYDNTYAAGDYTIKFDFYALEIGDNKNIVAQLTKPDWSGDAFPGNGQKWLEISNTLNEWQTLSFDITTVADGKFPWFYIGAGIKGYFDNFQIINKTTGETLLDFSPTASDLNKTSKDICTVVVFPTADDDDNSNIPVYKMLFDADEIFRTQDTSCTSNITVTFDYYLASGAVYADSANSPNGAFKSTLSSGVNSFTFTAGSETRSFKLAATEAAELYIWNVELTTDGTEQAFENRTNRTTCDVTEITYADIPFSDDDASVTSNDVLLIDTTANDNGTPKDFWFNELGMSNYYNVLESGKSYTITFDVYPITMPTGGNLFHYRTSNGSASSNAGWWGTNLVTGEWQTTSNTFTVGDANGNHVLYVYGGFKGYVDNVRFVDSDGNTVAGTLTEITGLTVPEKYAAHLEIVTLTESSDETVTSNDVLLIDTTANDNGTPTNFWFNELGMSGYGSLANGTYTIQFDVYPITMPSGNNLFHYRTGSGSGPSSDTGWWKPEMTLEQWTTTRNTFTVTDSTTSGNHILYVYGGFKGYVDNIVILDASGNEVAGTLTEITGLTVPEKYADYLEIVTLTESVEDDEQEDTLSSGMNITVLRGRAGKNGASIKLGGANSPLTLKSDTPYKLTFRYYQANPTNTGVLNLFGIDVGFDNEITYFKKNNTTGWATGYVYFSTGTVSDASADWLEIILNGNAWVYFDDFELAERTIDNNKEVTVVDFEQKDDTIYPDATGDNCTFGQTTDFSGTSNGSNGYFCATNSREYINEDKNSNQQYSFKGIKLKSYTTYKVSIDYYVSKPFSDYAFVVGYNSTNTGNGSGMNWQIWGNNKQQVGWATETFTFTTGEVVPNASYITIVIYDVANSSNPRVMYFDNLTFTELYKVDTSSNDSGLGTVTKTVTVEAGGDARVVANAYEGVTFEGWYEYGDLVSTEKIYVIENVKDNHKLVAHFSGEVEKPSHIIQGFEDYALGDILYEYYEIVDDPNNVLEGKQSLHVKEDKIEVNADHSLFFPLVSDVETLLKDDTEYDIYIWVKPAKPAESTTYFQIVTATEIADMSDLLTSPGGTGMQLGLKPTANNALEENNGWYKYLLGTVTTTHSTRRGFGVQICKFHAFRAEGASIDDLYIDKIELVERVPDYANLKFTENLFNEITNSDFESDVTTDDWAPLTAGLSVEKITDKEYDWQGDYNLKFDAAASNGEEYIRVIPVSKTDKNYTFAAWTKLSEGSDITVGLYKNGNYETFENVVNGENGTLPLVADGKWNRVSFTFNSGDSDTAYIVIKGTKGTLKIDMVELFIATRGYAEDPNSYGTANNVLQMVNPIAFPDVIRTETIYVENEEEEDSYVEINDAKDDVEDDDDTEETKKKTKKKRVVKVIKSGGTSPWLWAGIGAGALVVIAATVIFIIVFKKRKQSKKEAK